MDNTNPPVVRTQPSVVPILERIKLSDLFSVTDADFEPEVTRLRFRDNSPGAGHFLLGEQVLTSNAFIEIPATQLPAVSYRGANEFARETFSVQVYDGKYWSNIATNSITTGNVTPVVTVVPARLSEADTVRIDRFINVTDGDGDPILRYMLVDRKINAAGGQFFIDGVAQQQASWFTVNGGDFSRLMYRGTDVGRDVEQIGVMAWDGYSWSEIAEFEIATTTEPIVLPTTESVLVDQRRSAVAFFNSADQDNDPIFSYNVVDYRINPDGGYWEFMGNRMPSATWFTILATELNQLFYVGGSTGPQTERVGVQIFDGFQFSKVTNFDIKTVTPPEVSGLDVDVQAGHYLNMATGGTKNVLDGEVTGSMPILDFSDPDGDQIDEFMFNDLSQNSNGGHFVFKDVKVPSASYFRVPANELDQLFYRGGEFGPQGENISVLAHSNGVWSVPSKFRIGTLENRFAPELHMFEVNARAGTSMNLSGMFSSSDADGDAIHSFSFFDTGDEPNSGFFSVNGVTQPAKTWITLDWDQLGAVRYHLSALANTENIRMTVFDGRKVSTVESATMNAIAAPVIDATVNDISVDGIERVPAGSLFTQLDSGPSFRQYQIYDENTFFRSGRLELDGFDLQQGVVHTITADEFSRLVFKGAESDFGRQFDPMLVRAENGVTGWTEWERINVNTDPIGHEALVSGTQWTPQPGKTVLTYMFIDSFSPLPTYYICPPAENPDEECNNTKALNQAQRESIREVLAVYETAIDLDFVEVPWTHNAANATMIFGAADLPSGVGAWAYYPSGNVSNGYSHHLGDIWYNNTAGYDPTTIVDVSLGSNFRATTYHEIGHTLGLKHPHELDPALSVFLDFDYNTVMSYQHNNSYNIYPAYSDQPASAALYDIVELQRIYGANMEHNANNNHYGNFFSGSDPHFTSNTEQHQTTFWDAGGTDTFNFSNHVADETIDLREGTWTSINGVQRSLRIQYNTVIENARGGTGNDNIRGNEISNLLFGNQGNDVLRGGGDDDVLRGGIGDDTYIWSLGDGRDRVREEGNGGLDIVEFYDPSGTIDSLEDDFTVRRFGSELRIDLTLDQAEGQGTVSIINMEDPDSAVELMRIHGLQGTKIGNDIDLVSLFDIATSAPTRYFLTDTLGQNGGYIAAPLT